METPSASLEELPLHHTGFVINRLVTAWHWKPFDEYSRIIYCP